MILIDTHIHLYEYSNINSVIKESIDNGVYCVLCVSEDLETSKESINLSRRYKKIVYPLIGIHPWTATYSTYSLDKFSTFIAKNHHRVIGIGEIGLDKKYIEKSGEKWESQQHVFEYMLTLAKKYNLPVQVHSRKAAPDVLDYLLSYNISKAQFHWFSDDKNTLRRVIDNGYYISFTPSVTYSKKIMQLATLVPPELVLTETDGPIKFFGKFMDKETKPYFVKEIIIKLSEILGINKTDLSIQIIHNASRLYNINIQR